MSEIWKYLAALSLLLLWSACHHRHHREGGGSCRGELCSLTLLFKNPQMQSPPEGPPLKASEGSLDELRAV
jgi:hypothetical protein